PAARAARLVAPCTAPMVPKTKSTKMPTSLPDRGRRVSDSLRPSPTPGPSDGMGYTVFKPPVTTMLPFMALAHLVPHSLKLSTLVVGGVVSLAVMFWPDPAPDGSDHRSPDSED